MDFHKSPGTRIAWKLRDLHHRHSKHFHRTLDQFHLFSGQPRILFTIAHKNGATQRELAEAMHVTPASLSVSLKRMERAGLITKVQNKDDLRSNRIELTEKGRHVDQSSKQKLMAIDQHMISGFSDDEVDRLLCFLDRMERNLKDLEEERHD